ncbi:MAG: M1 family metallopeptidase [FCB group bacterium]|nr:M1 family metallopeptidase [FCB group bacterium]
MRRILIMSILFLVACKNQDVTIVEIESHNIYLKIDTANRSAELSDHGTMQVKQGWNLFALNAGVNVQSFKIENTPVTFQVFASADADDTPDQFRDQVNQLQKDQTTKILAFQSKATGLIRYSIAYSGEFYEDIENVRFSNENVGREVSATISEQGAYFSPSATYYPTGKEPVSSFSLTADIPADWESISDGNRVGNQSEKGRKIQSWENPFKNDGNMFMAAPFITKSTWVDSIEVACYFFAADTELFDQYLPATARYIRQYSQLIGPYPYRRFTVVENFFPTGYGMPAWTLLGQQVIRLPFIVYTSLGHEVLHNWWGNSVYVDYDRGNWCEAATVYGADYRYKLKRSPESAKTYRKDILKQYVNYVTPENDFPIREFINRTSPETRTIGYNKAMMVYHMIENEIGTESFFAAWKQIYTDYRGQKISWEEWMDMFGKTSGKDLSHIIPQWIDQAGAPVLDIRLDSVTDQRIHFTLLEKSGQNYRLEVPVHFDNGYDTTVVLNSPSTSYSMNYPIGAESISVDPDFHLFRRLYPEEIEPILSASLGNKNKFFFTDEESTLFKTFAENITERDVVIRPVNEINLSDQSGLPVVLNPRKLPEYISRRITRSEGQITINGKTYPERGHTFILTGQAWQGFKDVLVILSFDMESLPRIGELVPHYGKYSYLVFDGSKNVGKGQWEALTSPLKIALK